jgi:hypothetical protein
MRGKFQALERWKRRLGGWKVGREKRMMNPK